MSTKAGKDNNPNGSGPGDEQGEGGLVPAILAGVGILAVVGLLVFWPDGDEEAKTGDGKNAVADARGGKSAAGPNGKRARGGGGVGRAAVDDATPGSSAKGQVNPRLLPERTGMAPAVPAEEPPPKFANTAEEIAWYEKKLERANEKLASREKSFNRLDRARKRAEDSTDPNAMTKFERSKRIVEKNLELSKEQTAEIEKKLAELRGQ